MPRFSSKLVRATDPNTVTLFRPDGINPFAYGAFGNLIVANTLGVYGGMYTGPSTLQNLAAVGNQITVANIAFKRLANTSGAPLVLTSLPTIVAGSDGQQIILLQTSVNAITLQDEAILAGSALRLGGANLLLAQWAAVHLIYSASDLYWHRL